MGGRGSSSSLSSYSNSLRKAENSIRNNETESLIILDKNGKVLINKTDNQRREVRITQEEALRMKDNVLTHNHPGGTTFSYMDLGTAFANGLKEIRAVYSNGYYSLKRNFAVNEIIPDKYRNFASDYDKATKRYMKNTVDKVFAETRDAKKANSMVAEYKRKWLKENSKKYGWTYKEGK